MTGQTASDALGFGAYQQAAARTSAVATDHPMVNPALGLANEAGEVAGKVKKILQDRQGVSRMSTGSPGAGLESRATPACST